MAINEELKTERIADALEAFASAAARLSEVWEQAPREYAEVLNLDYPFNKSFTDVAQEILTWRDHYKCEWSSLKGERVAARVNELEPTWSVAYYPEGPCFSIMVPDCDEIWFEEGLEYWSLAGDRDANGEDVVRPTGITGADYAPVEELAQAVVALLQKEFKLRFGSVYPSRRRRRAR